MTTLLKQFPLGKAIELPGVGEVIDLGTETLSSFSRAVVVVGEQGVGQADPPGTDGHPVDRERRTRVGGHGDWPIRLGLKVTVEAVPEAA